MMELPLFPSKKEGKETTDVFMEEASSNRLCVLLNCDFTRKVCE